MKRRLSNTMQRLVLLGAPGVGKGTYAQLLAKELEMRILAVGDLVRYEIRKKSDIGQEMAKYSNSGKLVPDELILKLVQQKLTSDERLILDGFPRTVEQAEALDKVVAEYNVLNLQMHEPHLIQKLLGRRVCISCGKSFNVMHVLDEQGQVDMPPLLPSHGNPNKCDCGSELTHRKDDDEKIVRERLKVYKENTLPLVEYFKSKGRLNTVEIKKGLKDFPKILNVVLNFSQTHKL